MRTCLPLDRIQRRRGDNWWNHCAAKVGTCPSKSAQANQTNKLSIRESICEKQGHFFPGFGCFSWKNMENSPKNLFFMQIADFCDLSLFLKEKHPEFRKAPRPANQLAKRPFFGLVSLGRFQVTEARLFFQGKHCEFKKVSHIGETGLRIGRALASHGLHSRC